MSNQLIEAARTRARELLDQPGDTRKSGEIDEVQWYNRVASVTTTTNLRIDLCGLTGPADGDSSAIRHL